MLNRPHSITADVELPTVATKACCSATAAMSAATSLFVQDGKLHYVHNYVGAEELARVVRDHVPAGKHALRYEFEPTGAPDLTAGKGTPGTAQLFVDGDRRARRISR